MTHICVSNLTIIGSDNGLSPGRHQASIWTNAALLSIGTLRTYFSEILIKIQQFLLKKMHFKMSSAKRRPFCLGLNVLISYTNFTTGRSLWTHHPQIYNLTFYIYGKPITDTEMIIALMTQMHLWTLLFQVMICCLFNGNSLPKLLMSFCHLNPTKPWYSYQHKHFNLRKCIRATSSAKCQPLCSSLKVMLIDYFKY